MQSETARVEGSALFEWAGYRRLSGRATRAATLLASATLTLVLAACGGGDDGEKKVVPTAFPDVTDSSHATIRAANIFTGFFTAKSQHTAAPMVAFFAPAPATVLYVDAGLGLTWPSQQSLLDVWSGASFANGPPTALSYPVRVIGDEHSATIEFIDTPELLGSEFRFLSSITFDSNAKIVRWVDYWDGRSSKVRLPIGTLGPYPTDFHDDVVNASARIQQVSQALATALQAGDATAASQLFTADAVFEDMALHSRVEGKIQIERYLTRGLSLLPYGTGASLAHVSGSDQGGGYEWHASSSAAPLLRGITALELDPAGKITRFTTIYDSYQFTDAKYDSLVSLASELAPSP
ncbi:MAG: nuclear transport factor 2 family protein [Caldimonas sp.]